MILLLGGTSEAGTIAAALAAAGVRVLVSMTTDLASSVRESGLVTVRVGNLDEAGLHDLIVEACARVLVDATHPYASEATENAQRAADSACVPYLRYLRPPAVAGGSGVVLARDHQEAARRAMRSGRPVLLTIGTRHLTSYLREAKRAAVQVVARVLPTPESLRACEEVGLTGYRIVTGKGPFSVDQTVEVIRRYGIGVLVTKDGGEAGGVPEKLEAARREGCEIVVVERPAERVASGNSFTDVRELVEVCLMLNEQSSVQRRRGIYGQRRDQA